MQHTISSEIARIQVDERIADASRAPALRGRRRGETMRHKTTIALFAAILALTGPTSARADDAAAAAAKPAGVLATAQLAPLPGQTARGVAKIGVPRDGKPRGAIIAVLISAHEKVDVVLSARACGEIQDGTSNTILLSTLTVGPRGRGVSLNFEEIRYTSWRSARSIAFVAGEEVLACGALRKHRIDRRNAPIGAVTALPTNELMEDEGIFFGLLGTTYGGDGILYSAVATVGKEFDPATHSGRFQLAALRGTCPEAGSPMPRAGFRRLGRRFTVDESGAASLVIKMTDVIISSLRRARSVVLVRRAPDGVVVEACAPVRRFTLVR